ASARGVAQAFAEGPPRSVAGPRMCVRKPPPAPLCEWGGGGGGGGTKQGGVLRALDEAKKARKVRSVGSTGHKNPSIHLKMLSYNYPFDSVQMPLNAFDASYRSFQKRVLPEVNRLGMAGLGMKSLGGNGQPITRGVVTVEEALRYAMSLPVATTISGIDSLAVLRQNLAIARGFQPMPTDEMEALRRRCRRAAGDGHLELYKSTMKYDGDLGRGQHG